MNLNLVCEDSEVSPKLEMKDSSLNTGIAPATSSILAQFTIPLRILLAVACVCGLIGWAYVTLFVFAWGGRTTLYSPVVLILLFGDFYLLLSFYRSLKISSFKSFTITGAILNLPVVVYAVYLFSHIEDKLQLPALVPLFFLIVWLLLWLTRWSSERNISNAKQVLTITAICVCVVGGAFWIGAHAKDPSTEAHKLSELAVQAGNADEARQLFARAKDQASRIKNPYIREEPLQVIAYNQAKAGLVTDAEVTANECVSDSARKMAFNAIVRGQVDHGDWNGAVVSAKAHDAGSVLFMALKEHCFANAEAGNIDKAKEIMRFAEQAASDPAFKDLRRWSFGYVALVQAKLGLHDEALSSAKKTGAEYAPEHFALVALTEKQAGYFENSGASIHEAIDAVKALRSDTASRDHTFYELAGQIAEWGMLDEAVLVGESIQSANTKDILFRSIEYKRGHSR